MEEKIFLNKLIKLKFSLLSYHEKNLNKVDAPTRNIY